MSYYPSIYLSGCLFSGEAALRPAVGANAARRSSLSARFGAMLNGLTQGGGGVCSPVGSPVLAPPAGATPNASPFSTPDGAGKTEGCVRGRFVADMGPYCIRHGSIVHYRYISSSAISVVSVYSEQPRACARCRCHSQLFVFQHARWRW